MQSKRTSAGVLFSFSADARKRPASGADVFPWARSRTPAAPNVGDVPGLDLNQSEKTSLINRFSESPKNGTDGWVFFS